MFKKTLIGSVAFTSGFLLRDYRAGEEILLENTLIYFTIAFALGLFIQWTSIPYDWNKNKDKEKKNLG